MNDRSSGNSIVHPIQGTLCDDWNYICTEEGSFQFSYPSIQFDRNTSLYGGFQRLGDLNQE